jgi:hypothetical protein
MGASEDDIWKLGEDVIPSNSAGNAFRYMNDPASGGHYDWYPTRYIGSQDNGGVHWNSGIANLAFYLLVKGGEHPRSKSPGVTVTGIGYVEAAKIFYHANADCLTQSATFEMARYCTADALEGLHSENVHAAWDAVGVPKLQPPPASYAYKLLLHTDNYPGETTWTITDDCKDNELVAEGGPYYSAGADEIAFILEEGKYTLTVNDSYGDGLCCNYGNGAISVSRQDGTLTASIDTSFTSAASASFGSNSCSIPPSDTMPPSSLPSSEPSTSVAPSTMPSEHPSSAPSSTPPFFYKLLLHTDNYPGETTWTITDDCKDNELVKAGGPYTSAGADVESFLILEEGKYTLTVNDSYGDGLCCNYGNGAFSVSRQDGTLTASIDTFTSAGSASFGSNSCLIPLSDTMPPSSLPSSSPSSAPSTGTPSTSPSASPSGQTSSSTAPSSEPTSTPSVAPSTMPSDHPSSEPSSKPSDQPSNQPSSTPSSEPTSTPSVAPSTMPSEHPSSGPSSKPSDQPSKQPSSTPIWTEIFANGFESGYGNFNDGGKDSNLDKKSHTGSKSLRLRDGSGSSLSFTDPFTVSIYSTLKVEFWYMSSGFDVNDDSFSLQSANVDGGTGTDWVTKGTWTRGSNVFTSNGTWYFASVEFAIDADTSTMRIQFMSDSDDDREKVYIDDVTVSGEN